MAGISSENQQQHQNGSGGIENSVKRRGIVAAAPAISDVKWRIAGIKSGGIAASALCCAHMTPVPRSCLYNAHLAIMLAQHRARLVAGACYLRTRALSRLESSENNVA